jgi:protein NRD1
MRAFYSTANDIPPSPMQDKPAVVPEPAQPAPPTPQGSNAIMEALAKLTSQAASAPAPPAQPALPQMATPIQAPPPPQAPVAIPPNLASLLSSLAKHTTPVQTQPPSYPPQNYQAPPVPQNYQAPIAPQSASPQPPVAPQNHTPYLYPSPMPAFGNNGVGYPAPAPPAPALPPAAAGMQGNMEQQVILIKALAEQGIPFEQIPAVIQKMQAAGRAPTAGALSGPPPPLPPYSAAPAWGQAPNVTRSPELPSRRSRSRSPGRSRDGRSDQRGDRRFDDPRGSRGSEYRQRSPVGHRQGGDPMNPPAHRGEDKWIEYDRTLPDGHIRVFSRTLFVGGVM